MKKRYAYLFVAGLLLAFAAGVTGAVIDIVMRRVPEDTPGNEPGAVTATPPAAAPSREPLAVA